MNTSPLPKAAPHVLPLPAQGHLTSPSAPQSLMPCSSSTIASKPDTPETSAAPVPTVLVLGGATSMLGQALVQASIAKGWKTHSLGRADGPVLDAAFIEERLASLQPDFIFNTIAYTAVDEAETHPEDALALNKHFPAMLGRLLRGSTAHLLHYSTDFVFNGKKKTPYTEQDSTEPLNIYGSSKLAGEQSLAGLNNVCVIRTAWLFGHGRKNFISTILKAAQSNPTLTVVHDQVGSPTFTADLAVWSLALAQVRAQGLVHAVNAGQASWCELASEALGHSSLSATANPITSDQWPQAALRPAYSVLNTDKLTALTGLKPRPWPQALREYLFEMMRQS